MSLNVKIGAQPINWSNDDFHDLGGNTPLETCSPGDIETTLNTIALMRIINPGALIPSVSALEKLQEGGQVKGLNAGANVITINFTPKRERQIFLSTSCN